MIVYLFNCLGAFRRTRGALVFALLLTATLDPCSGAAQRRSNRGGAQAQPRLVVLIVVDALGYEYLARHESVLGSGGFRRLLAGGASFADARYAYAGTRTAPGHASIATGALPAVHGVVANNWFDRATGKEVAFEDDAGERIVGRAAAADPPGVSPRNLIGSTIADELREATGGRARVVSLSVKTRAAVILGGHRPAGAYWFDEETGKAVTSSYYRVELPPWVQAINARGEADKRFGGTWDRLLPVEAYNRFGPDDQAGEEPVHGTRTFPHRITGGLTAPGPDFYEALTTGPYGNELVLELALAALDGERLGADAVPDLLALSFSGHDNVGHSFGPNSHEVLDVFVRLDRQIAALLAALDKRLGDGYAVLLTSDHGLTPLVEVSRSAGYGAERIHPDGIKDKLEAKLDTDFGAGDWVLYLDDENLYLNRALAAERQADWERMCRVAGETLMGIGGIEAYITAADRLSAAASADARLAALGAWHHAKRSGDVVFLTSPFSLVRDDPDGTAHGSPYSYDTHVPLIAYRCGVPPGVWRHPVSPLDIAPTLAWLLGTGLPSSCQGHALAPD